MCDRLFRYGVTLCGAVLVAVFVTAAAKAGTFPSPSDSIPNLNEVDLNGNSANYAGPHQVSKFLMHGFSQISGTTTAPDPGGGAFTINSFFDVFVDINLDGTLYTGLGVGHLTGSGIDNLPATSTFNTQMLQLDISGGSLPGGVRFRVDPVSTSSGQDTVMDTGGGQFRIDSFFDIFVDLSLDGGVTWSPPSAAIHVASETPEPATIVLMGLGSLLLGLRVWRGNQSLSRRPSCR